ncbi:hypothetical protein BUALT_Bualt12G0094200 [Buddleja alternifolia]|uniref:Actin-related protein 6 n=1 Tax=Buddleja alternifolia TaxID=168488 RepID=A0AAV6WW55_9LAMI|nr:hypothetical protein BUALT_Bualt12G0094200 [Buddleja alternifolia]
MSNVVVVDNGGGLIKAGIGGERDPTCVVPNCTARPPSSKKWLVADQLSGEEDLTSATLRRPFDRGHIINPDLQSSIWSHLFTNLLKIHPPNTSLLLTQPLFTLPSIQRSMDEIVFEEFNFKALFVADSPSLVHLYEASRRPYGLVSKAQCSLVVDSGFSFTHAAPVLQNFTLNYGVKRMDLGGKALTNYLKELVSYRSVNVMDESFIMDDVKEKLCFVSLHLQRDLNIARSFSLILAAIIYRRPGNDNMFRCTYVLPDGVTYMKGFVKDPGEAKRYLALDDEAASSPAGETDFTNKPQDRRTVDLTKNEFSLTNERFLVPEMIFRPADLGMNQAGLAECIVRAVNSCHPHLHPVLYESIILTGGNTLLPGFAQRLEREIRPLVPDEYQVKITTQEDPILGVWRGGSLLASSPDFEAMCVTKAEYEELGSARLVHGNHHCATKKNKEWQEKLPILVLKAEEIMYSKANSEAEYSNPETVWDRVNDAIDTIIRKDETTETGDQLLPPCVEAALNLGCVPVRASRSQRHNYQTTYLRPAPQNPPKFPNENPVNNHHNSLSISMPFHTSNTDSPPPRCSIGNINNNTIQVEHNTRGSVYPLYYGTTFKPSPLQPQKSDSIIVGVPIFSSLAETTTTTAAAEVGHLHNLFPCDDGKDENMTKETSKGKEPEMGCDLSLRLGLFSDSNSKLSSFPSVIDSHQYHHHHPKEKEFSFFPVDSSAYDHRSHLHTSSKWNSEGENHNMDLAASRKRKLPFNANTEYD